jgi:DNA-binding NtrC family response regulator
MARVLVVDDDNEIRHHLVNALVKVGHEVSSAADGHAALALAGDFDPDVILLDLQMPVMDGRAFAHARPSKRARLIVISGNQDLPTIASAMGAHRFLQKPFELDQVIAAVDSAISARDTSR